MANTITTDGSKWVVDATIDTSTGFQKTLTTAGTYVDRNIDLDIKVQGATSAANTASADVSVNTADGGNAGVNISGVIGTKTTTEPTSGYYVSMTASGSGSSKITKAGFIGTGNLAAASTTATKYFPITGATINNKATSGVTYTDTSSSAPALVEGDYLYIDAGYTPAQKISLAKLVPDGTTVGTTTSSDLIYKTATARNDDGKLITGTMGDAKVTSPNASITSLTYTYNTTNKNYDVTGSKAIGGPTVNTAGYITSSIGTKAGGTASVATTVAASTETNNTTLPSGSTSSGTINAGSYIKIAAGYNPNDRYYKAQDASDGTKATVTSGSVTISSLTYTYDSTNKRYNVTGGANNNVPGPTVGTAGYISSSVGTKNTGTAKVSTTLAETNISKALVADTSKTSGYSVMRTTASAGYNASAKTSDITVYQGTWS